MGDGLAQTRTVNVRVALADSELEVDSHTGETGDGNVGTVDERDGVDGGEDGDEAPVDLAAV